MDNLSNAARRMIQDHLPSLSNRPPGFDLAAFLDEVIDFCNSVQAEVEALPLTATALASPTALTIASGVITVTQNYHTVDTEAAAGSDNLDTINGLDEDQVAFIKPADGARTVVLRSGQDNIVCHSGENITMADASDIVMLIGLSASVVAIPLAVLADSGSGLGAALAAVTTGKGASLVGVEDAGLYFTAATVEAILAEIGAIIAPAGDAVDGNHTKKVLRVTFDPSTNAGERTIGTHTSAVTLPDKARVTRSWYVVKTTFQSAGADAGTIAIGIATDDADGIVAALAISNGANIWDAGLHEGIQTGTAANMAEVTTAARAIEFVVGGQALTAGKLYLYLEYVIE